MCWSFISQLFIHKLWITIAFFFQIFTIQINIENITNRVKSSHEHDWNISLFYSQAVINKFIFALLFSDNIELNHTNIISNLKYCAQIVWCEIEVLHTALLISSYFHSFGFIGATPGYRWLSELRSWNWNAYSKLHTHSRLWHSKYFEEGHQDASDYCHLQSWR